MKKKIPIYFDTAIVSSPLERISESNANVGRLQVRVFTKYGNRNGSYITDEVAEQLIQSATQGSTPVIGFFDPESESWAGHTGPKLANGYGYVESFIGWKPFTDTDNVEREYAVFSVVLFTDYFEEAQKILGENQSMELDPFSIDGDWADINGQEYFVYTKAKILGLCIIGKHEPCFSVSAFFSKNDDQYKSQYEKFSSLLSSLKTFVEEATNFNKGGERPMNEFEKETVEVEEIEKQNTETETEFEQVQEQETEPSENFEEVEVKEAETEVETVENNTFQIEEVSEVVENTENFEALQTKYNELEDNYNALKTEYDNQTALYNQTTEEVTNLRATVEQLQASLQTYEAQANELLENKKNELINKYEKQLDAEEISNIRANVKNFSYEALESKLAIAFANKSLNNGSPMILVPKEESEFASLMKNYKK